MLPESMAPPLANYDEFKAFMEEHGIRAMREYIPPGEDPETGEPDGDFWTVVISKEKKLPDDRIYMHFIDSGERHVLSGWRQAWELEAELLEAAFKYGYEDAVNGKS